MNQVLESWVSSVLFLHIHNYLDALTTVPGHYNRDIAHTVIFFSSLKLCQGIMAPGVEED